MTNKNTCPTCGEHDDWHERHPYCAWCGWTGEEQSCDSCDWWKSVDERWFYAAKRVLPDDIFRKLEAEWNRLGKAGNLEAARKSGNNIPKR